MENMETDNKNNPLTGVEIAVIGMAGRFPGAKNIEEFWENLKKGKETLSFLTDSEVEELRKESAMADDPNFVRSKGGIIEGEDRFDAEFFGYIPAEADVMDPQIRIFHQTAWEALEEAGYDTSTYPGLIGLFAGASNSFNWEARTLITGKSFEVGQFEASHLSDKDYLCSRISYKLNLKGPAVAVQTACSTSLVAIHLASQAILNGECDMALAGGVRVAPPLKGYLFQEGMILSPDGHCRAFDARAKGTITGNGVGVVLLKSLEDALDHGDHIHAIVKGTAINNDGTRKSGYSAPSREAQTEVIQVAQQVAEVESESITYIETHGTGTTLGDPIEIEALKKGFSSEKKGYCSIGSVKTNVGHLGSAAGVTGFIKTILALKHRRIPPSLHYEKPNPNIDFENSPFYVNTNLSEWESNGTPLRAGVSSFGIGGTNAHVILEEAPHPPTGSCSPSEDCYNIPHHLILLSARTQKALEKQAINLANHLGKKPNLSIWDLSFTLKTGRKGFQYRRKILCKNIPELIENLRDPEKGKNQTFKINTKKRNIIFMFSGLGNQYLNMGLELYQKEPQFREIMDTCFDLLKPLIKGDIKKILYPNLDGGGVEKEEGIGALTDYQKFDQPQYAHPILFIFEYALATLLLKWGITPQAMIGYSFGEYVAACISEVFTLEEALKLVVNRARLIQQTEPGVMLSIPLPPKEIEPILDEKISLSIDNGTSCIVSGTEAAIQGIEATMKKRRCLCMRLTTNRALHSSMMEPILQEFEKQVSQISLKEPKIPYISNLTGDWITIEEVTEPGYWVRHLRETVQFDKGINEMVTLQGCIYIEIGPGRDLFALIQKYLEGKTDHKVTDLIRHPVKEVSDLYYLKNRIGQLWQYGLRIDWKEYDRGKNQKRIPLPTYPFEEQTFWIEDNLRTAAVQGGGVKKQPGFEEWFSIPSWKRSIIKTDRIPEKRTTDKKRRWLIFLDNQGIGTGIQEKIRTQDEEIITVLPGEEFKQISNNRYELNPNQSQDYRKLLEELFTLKKSPEILLHLWNITKPGQTKTEKDESEPGFQWFYEAQEYGFYSILNLAKAISSLDTPGMIEINMVTNNMQEVSGQEELCPEKASLLGPVKVIPQEHPGILCRSMDILLPKPGTLQEERVIQQIWTESINQIQEPVVAFRGNHRWVQTFEQMTIETVKEEKLPLKQEGVYLITGGFGEIGLILAEYLAQKYQAKLVLTGRNLLPLEDTNAEAVPKKRENQRKRERDKTPQKIARLKKIKETATTLLQIKADASNYKEMKQAVQQAEEELGSIDGIIHAAGITKGSAFSLVRKIGKNECQQQFKPKVDGLIILHHLFKAKPVDFCWIISSLSAVLGGLEFVAYAAANIFMDAFINRRNQDYHKNWLTVNWDGMDPQKTVEGFQRTIGLEEINQVVVSNGGNLQDRIDKWVKLETLREQEADNQQGTSALKPRPELMSTYVKPKTPEEETIAEIWQKMFGFQEIGVKDDFFELGGDSLKAITVISRIHRAMKVEIPITEFFKRVTIEKLVEYITQAEETVIFLIQPREHKEYYPLSSAQKRLYIIQEMLKESIGYNEVQAIYLEGEINKEGLEEATRELMNRHQILRASIQVIEGNAVQRIHPLHEVPIQIQFQDFSKLPVHEKQPDLAEQEGNEIRAQVETWIRSFVKPFDLSKAPFLRIGLIKLEQGKQVLVIDRHHIITDGVSQEIFFQELKALYQGNTLAPLKIQYQDYSEWQQGKEQQQELKKQEEYWEKQFEDTIPVLHLPYDYPRPLIQSYEGNSISFTITREETTAIKEQILSSEVTIFMYLLAIYDIFLAKVTLQDDMVVGTPIAGRKHPELQGLIGTFINMLPLRNYLDQGIPFRKFLKKVKETTLTAFENQEYQFEDLIDQLSINRDVGRNPLFDVAFVLQNAEAEAGTIPEVEMKEMKIGNYGYETRVTKFDLHLNVVETETQLMFTLRYCTKLFKIQTIHRLIQIFQKITQAVILNPETIIADIEIMTQKEKDRILWELNDTHANYPREKTLLDLFEVQVKKQPHAPALEFREDWMTFKELEEHGNRIANYLFQEGGITTEVIVGILMDKSLDVIPSIMGVLMAGGAYLPLSPGIPQNRIKEMIQDSDVTLVLSQKKFINTLNRLQWEIPLFNRYICLDTQQIQEEEEGRQNPLMNQEIWEQYGRAATDDISRGGWISSFTGEPIPEQEMQEYAENPTHRSVRKRIKYQEDATTLIKYPTKKDNNMKPGPQHLAYVIYTSGTTGKPKGVMVNHQSLTNLIIWHHNYYQVTPKDRTLQYADMGFDATVWEIFPYLTKGICVHVLPQSIRLDIEKLIDCICKYKISICFLPTQFCEQFEKLGKNQKLPLKKLLTGGDKLKIHSATNYQLYNNYGPTENTVVATACRVKENYRDIPIGKPIYNNRITILHPEHDVLQPIGVVGELCISGESLARGYLNEPEMTDSKFVSNPLIKNEKIYRTGDMARWLEDGHIEYKGRKDNQVKVRGYRIEIQDIEHHLLRYPGIKEVAVIDREDKTGSTFLCAYIISQKELQLSEVREYLLKKIPDYMVPSSFIPIDHLPLTPNGKVDMNKLPEPEIKAALDHTPPRSNDEHTLAEIWALQLGIKKEVIGIDSNFFELGGHSLNATLVIAKIHKELSVRIPLTELFLKPTIRGLSQYIKESCKETYMSVEPAEKKEYYPLTSAQKRLFILQQMDPGSIAYNVPQVVVMENDLDKRQLEQTFLKLIKRHESLRTSFHTVHQQPVQRVHEEVSFTLQYIKPTPGESIEQTGQGERPEEKVIRQFIKPFYLAEPHQIRVAILQARNKQFTMVVDMHHIISDAISNDILIKDFLDLYAGKELPPLKLQYKDFSLLQEQLRKKTDQKEVIKKQENYWLKEYKGELPLLQLPLDFERPSIKSLDGENQRFIIEDKEAEQLKRMAYQANATLYMVVLSIYNIMLSKLSGQSDLVVGSPILGRRHADLHRIIGMFVGTLALRNYPKADKGFLEFLAEVQQRTLEAFENQDYPFEELQDKIYIEKDPSRSPVFDVLFQFRAADKADLQSEAPSESETQMERGVHFEISSKTSKFDMYLYGEERGNQLMFYIEYSTRLFKPDTIARFIENFKEILSQVLQNPEIQLKDITITHGLYNKEIAIPETEFVF
jgi:amino acid adenylation domain-containing protein